MSRRPIFLCFSLIAFWLLLFFICRMAFILANFTAIPESAVGNLSFLEVFVSGSRVDLSTACFFLLPAWVMMLIQALLSNKSLQLSFNIYGILATFIVTFITFGEIGIYPEWQSKLTAKALEYLKKPDEVIRSGSLVRLAAIWLSAIFVASMASFAFVRVFGRSLPVERLRAGSFVMLLFAGIVGIGLGLRGGWQPIPLNLSSAYFSKHAILNDAAVNPVFNLAMSVARNQSFMERSPFESMDQLQKDKILTDLLPSGSNLNSKKIFDHIRPNIVMVVLESWSAAIMNPTGEVDAVTPNFSRLAKEGLYFDQMYASGNRSQQGLAALLSGFPALPITTLSAHPEKYRHLPSLTDKLSASGYDTSFYFGGDLSYGGIKSFIMSQQFQKVMDQDDYPEMETGQLGIHDQYTLDFLIDEIDRKKEPFFATQFTLSSHSPYDMPLDPWPLKMDEQHDPYLNSVHYSDWALGQFIEKAKKKDWYQNTIFVFVADHSHVSHVQHNIRQPEYRKIPMLVYGEPLQTSWRGSIHKTICSQVDLAATLLHQLEMTTFEFKYSKDCLSSSETPYAFYELNSGLGWIEDRGQLSLDVIHDVTHFNTFDEARRDKAALRSKAYLQEVFQDFLDLPKMPRKVPRTRIGMNQGEDANTSEL